MMLRLCVVCKASHCVTIQCTLNKAQQSLGARVVQIRYALEIVQQVAPCNEGSTLLDHAAVTHVHDLQKILKRFVEGQHF